MLAAGSARADEARCLGSALGELTADGDALRVVVPGAAVLQAGDLLVQLNGHRLAGCSELHAALSEARERHVNVLLLIDRGGITEMVSLELPAEVAPPLSSEKQLAEGPTVAGPSALPPVPPPELREGDAALVRQTAQELVVLGREIEGRLPLLTAQPWVRKIADLRDTYERRKAETPAVAVAQGVVDNYQTVGEILTYREEKVRGLGRDARRPGVTLEFTSGSPVASWLRRHPFLTGSIVREPQELSSRMAIERSGYWVPDTAIRLLVEHAIVAARGIEPPGAN